MSKFDKHETFLRTKEPRECPACWGNGYTLDRHEEQVPCSTCAETGRVVPFVPSAELDMPPEIPRFRLFPTGMFASASGEWVQLRDVKRAMDYAFDAGKRTTSAMKPTSGDTNG